MYYSVLEYVNLCGFGMVNYSLNDSQIESTIREILDYKFKQEIKIIYEGADIYTHLEHEKWKQRCQTLLQTFFLDLGSILES